MEISRNGFSGKYVQYKRNTARKVLYCPSQAPLIVNRYQPNLHRF